MKRIYEPSSSFIVCVYMGILIAVTKKHVSSQCLVFFGHEKKAVTENRSHHWTWPKMQILATMYHAGRASVEFHQLDTIHFIIQFCTAAAHPSIYLFPCHPPPRPRPNAVLLPKRVTLMDAFLFGMILSAAMLNARLQIATFLLLLPVITVATHTHARVCVCI